MGTGATTVAVALPLISIRLSPLAQSKTWRVRLAFVLKDCASAREPAAALRRRLRAESAFECRINVSHLFGFVTLKVVVQSPTTTVAPAGSAGCPKNSLLRHVSLKYAVSSPVKC